jgi:hypothetical protein
MEIKVGVKIENVSTDLLYAMYMTARLMDVVKVDFVVTSVNDGVHKVGSLHYKGNAFDFRIRNFGEVSVFAFCSKLRLALGSKYDVVLESDHVHVEYDPS